MRFFNTTFKEVNLSVDVFRKSGDGKASVFRYTSVDVIDGEINLEIKNTFSWYAKLKDIEETEEFYVKVFDPAIKRYIPNDKNEIRHAQFLKINKKVVSKEVKPPTNLSPLKTGEPDKNAVRFEPCKFETITIIEDKNEEGKISKIKTLIFDNGKKLADQVLTKEPIRKAILFEFDKYVITPEGKIVLNNTLQFLVEHQFSTVKIDGHACVIGKENYNQKLSQQRSDAVKKVFVDGGLDARLITSVGHGEVNPTDDKQGRDNLKYRDEKEYKRNRCVDISFDYYGHDAQTIVYETIAPSLDKNITIDITEYQNKSCFREKGKHTKNIKITSPEYTKSIDIVANKLDFPIKSNLVWWNISPLKYIWPKVFPNNYNIHVHSCRYFSNDANSTLRVIVYPDIKWTLEFSFNFSNPLTYTHGNLPEYSRKISPEELKYQKSLNEKQLAQRQGDLQRVKELTRNMREAQSKAVSVGKENARIKNSPVMLSKFELKLIAEWDDKREKRELGFEFAEKLRKVLNIFLKYKEMADKVQDTLGGFPKGAALSKTPFMFEIQSPSLNASISWYLEKGQDNFASQIATVGTLNFKADPLMGANFIVDLLALGSRMHPAVAAMVTGAQVALSALHGGITFEAKFYGLISFDFKAVEINSLTGIKGGNLDLGAKVGIQVTLDIQFEVKSKVWSADVVVKLRANVKADAHFAAKILFDSDKKGIYAKPEIGFSGLIITLKAELVINGLKKTLQISNEGEPFLKSDIAKFDPIYILIIKKMKQLIMTFFLSILFSCQSNLSQEIKEKINKKEPFWKVRNQTINKNKNTMEYPLKKDTTVTEQRTNRIYLRSNNCQFEAFVDDVLLYKEMGESTKKGGGVSTNFDINQLLLTSGTHEIKIRMYPKYNEPVFGEGGYVGLTFSYFKNRDLRTKEYNLNMNGEHGIDLDQTTEQWVDNKGELGNPDYVEAHYEQKKPLPLKGLPIYEWRSTFDAQVDFDKIGWRNSVNLKKEQDDEKKDIRTELLKEYQKIHEILAKKDVAGYLSLVREREELVTATLHYRESEKELRSNEFVQIIKDNDYELEPLFEETFQLEYQAYGKIIMFLHKADGEGIIKLKNKKNPAEVIHLDFRFQRKEEGGKLSVI